MSSLLIALLGPYIVVAACLCAGRVAVAEVTGDSMAVWSTLAAQRRLRAIAVIAVTLGIAATVRVHALTCAPALHGDWRSPTLVAALGFTFAAYAYGEVATERAGRSGRTTVSIHPLVIRKNVARVLVTQCGLVTLFVCTLLSSICI